MSTFYIKSDKNFIKFLMHTTTSFTNVLPKLTLILNKKMVRTEILTKRLGVIISKHSGGKKVFPKRTEGKVWVGWQPLAWIAVESSTAFSVVWNLKLAAEMAMPKEQIEVELRAAGRDTEDVQ